MNKVSHREFTRVKNSFGNNHIHYYTRRAPMNCTPDDDWVDITWKLNGEGDELFSIFEKHGKKEYFVSDGAYKILRILKQYGLRQENAAQADGISW